MIFSPGETGKTARISLAQTCIIFCKQANESSINLHVEAKEHMYIHFHLLLRQFEEEDCSLL